MARPVKHFSLHRIGETELQVIADVEAGVLSVIQVEEEVIRRYATTGGPEARPWPHRWVTLFILQNLQPLVRQLRAGAELPPGGAAALDYRPVLNVYDLANQAACHVFVNQQAMVKEGYWDDLLATRGLLAHEHAHPLAENETTRTSRRLQVELSLEGLPSASRSSPGTDPGQRVDDRGWTRTGQDKALRLLILLADKLCCYAPREVFANEMAIHSGFGEALFYLNRRNVANADRSVAGREELRRQLQQGVIQKTLTSTAADALLLIGDLKGYLDLALEVAPFYRTGRESDARELEAVLETAVFPHLEPGVARAYTSLRELYRALRADMAPAELKAWGDSVLSMLAQVLAEKGMGLHHQWLLRDEQ
jgi:hypothetical protein